MNENPDFFVRSGDGTFAPSSVCAFRYPMGDLTVVGHIDDPSLPQVCYYAKTSEPNWTLVTLWAEFLREQGVDERVLILPYLPGARGDKDSPSPAKVNATLAATTGITHLITVDPHSPVWLDEFTKAAPEVAVTVIPVADIVADIVISRGYTGIVAPDAGARERATQVAQDAGDLPVVVARKVRDKATGKLMSYELDLPEALTAGPLLAVDDICDGGGTFQLMASALPDDTVIDLWVTHGGFTKGTAGITEKFRTVYTTDSIYSGIDDTPDAVHTIALAPHFARLISTITP